MELKTFIKKIEKEFQENPFTIRDIRKKIFYGKEVPPTVLTILNELSEKNVLMRDISSVPIKYKLNKKYLQLVKKEVGGKKIVEKKTRKKKGASFEDYVKIYLKEKFGVKDPKIIEEETRYLVKVGDVVLKVSKNPELDKMKKYLRVQARKWLRK